MAAYGRFGFLIFLGAVLVAAAIGVIATSESVVALSPVDTFVQRLYVDILGRPADPGAQLYIDFLNNNGNTQLNRQSVALQLLQGQEYRTNLLQSLYQLLLGRSALPAEITAGLSLFQNGSTDEQVIAEIASLPEYYSRAGGTNAAFIDRLYQDVLGRPADAGAQVFITFLNNNGNTANNRRTVVLQIDQSAEYRTRLVGGFYQKYLRRAGLAGEINGWVLLMQNGTTDEQVIAGIVSQDEYFQLAQALATPTPANSPTSTNTSTPTATSTVAGGTPTSTPATGNNPGTGTSTPTSTPTGGGSSSGPSTNNTGGGPQNTGSGIIPGTAGRPPLPPVFQNPGAVAIVNARPFATPRPSIISPSETFVAPVLRPPSTGGAGLAH